MAAAGFFCLLCGYYTLRPMREALALEVGVQYNSHPVLGGARLFRCAAAHLLVAGGAHAARPAAVARVDAVRARVPGARRRASPGRRANRTRRVRVLRRAELREPLSDLGLLERDGGRLAAGAREALLRLRRRGRQRRRDPRSANRSGSCTSSDRRRSSSSPARSSWARRCSLRSRAVRCGVRRMAARCPTRAIPVGGRAVDDLARLARSPYLLGIAGIIVAGQIIGAFMYNEQGKLRRGDLHVARRSRGAVRAHGVLRQPAVAVLPGGGGRPGSRAAAASRSSLSAMPVLIGGSFVALALYPIGDDVPRARRSSAARRTTASANHRARCCSRC